MKTKPSRPAPIPFDEALAGLLKHAAPVGATEEVPTLEADGRVLAQAVVSPLAVPEWDNSQMDGYAVRASDLAGGDALADREQRRP